MNPGPYVKSLVPAILAVLYSLQSWVLTGHIDLAHVRASVFGLVLAAVVYWLPNTPKVTAPNPVVAGTSIANEVGLPPLSEWTMRFAQEPGVPLPPAEPTPTPPPPPPLTTQDQSVGV